MWVNSKEAADILGVNLRKLQRCVVKAQNSSQKILTIDTQKTMYQYTNGRGGASGKILQIWIDDEIVAAHKANLEGKEGFWGANTQISTSLNASLQGGERTQISDSLNTSEHPASFTETSANAERYTCFKGETGEFRSEISPEGITSSAITTRALSLNFTTKEANAGSSNREYASKRVGTDDAKRDGIGSGGSSEAVKIPAFCKEYEQKGLCGKDNGSRSVWMENKGGVDGGSTIVDGDGYSVSNIYDMVVKGDIDESGKESGAFSSVASNKYRNACAVDSKGQRGICKNRQVARCTAEMGDEIEAKTLPLIATCSDKKRKAAFSKYEVIQEWQKAKGKVKDSAFIEYINAKNICSIKVTINKLYDWQRKYKNGGLDALVDERTNNKRLTLEVLGLKEYAIKLINAQQGRVNITNIYNLLNYEAIKSGKFSLEAFNGKKDECVSYEIVNRFVNRYLNENKLLKNIILYGEDGAISRAMPSLGVSNWAVDSINQIVEIDASPLDLICNASDICNTIGFEAVDNIFKDKAEFETYVKEWQKRYTIIALIDTYSGVATFHITDTENSVGIARAVAKYILRYGKPRVIKGDNGKAFKSEYINSVMNALGIEYRAVRAYSGWLKPYVERNFRALQHNFTANLAGFIGHNIIQRQAIEFFYSKKERRLKKGYKTNLKELKNLAEVQRLMDLYAEKFLNTRYLERLEMSVSQAYNQKAHEAVAMNALSLSARLSKRELKSVNKKGISVDGLYYQSSVLFSYERVWVNKNIDNTHECFIWNDKNEFVGVATLLDDKNGTSVEIAKASQKLFNKRLKEIKQTKQEATGEVREKFISFIEDIETKTALKPTQKAVNSESMMINTALKTAAGIMKNEALSDEELKVAGSDTKRDKKYKGWEYFGTK